MNHLSFHVELDPRQTPPEVTEKDLQEVQQMLPDLISAVLAVRHQRRLAARDTLVDLFAGQSEITPADSAQARDGRPRAPRDPGRDRAVHRPASRGVRTAGPRNRIGSVSRWKSQGRSFAIRQGNRDLYPRYALRADFHPLDEMREILQVLRGYSPTGPATWFESTNSFLGGKRPRELLATNPELVVAAAKDEVESREFAS